MINGKKVLVVIPARNGGYRFPNKPLKLINGKPMLEWVWRHAISSKYADKVVIATPNQEIIDICTKFGAEVVKTSDKHRRGTERVGEAFVNLGESWDIVVNFQGDEPLVTGDLLDTAIKELAANPTIAAANLFKTISYENALTDQNEVKVVVDAYDNALYFSRNPLPAKWLGDKSFECKVVVAVMPMWSWALKKFSELPNAYYEEIESVDMLRFTENRLQVRQIKCEGDIKSVDCEEDLIEAERMLIKLYGKQKLVG